MYYTDLDQNIWKKWKIDKFLLKIPKKWLIPN